MEALFNKIAIRDRIVLIVGIIVLALSGFIWAQINTEMTRSQALDKVSELNLLTPHISNVVHELQKERGLSAGYIGSKADSLFSTVLKKQKSDTNSMLKALGKSYEGFDWKAFPGELEARAKNAAEALDRIENMRSKVVSLGATVPQMATYYSQTIGKLLQITKQIAGLTTDASLLRDIAGYIAVLELKERAGQERAFGTFGFAKKGFPQKGFQKFVSLIAAQQIFMGQFEIYSSASAVKFFKDTVVGTDVDKIDKWRALAMKTPADLSASNVSGSDWYNTITKKINLLKIVEDKLVSDISAKSDMLAEEARTNFNFIATLSAILLVVTILVSFFTIRSISRPLKDIQDSVTALSSGNLDIDVPFTAYGSEIGKLASSIQIFKESGIENRNLREEADRSREEATKAEEERRENEQKAEQERGKEREDAERLADEKRVNERLEMAQMFEDSVGTVISEVNSSATNLSSTADDMTRFSEKTSVEAKSASEATQQAGANVQNVAAASEEMSSSVDEIRRQVDTASEKSGEAVTIAEVATGQVDQLSEAAKSIRDVVSLIDDIAGKTNLLALNATIEAARAGDAGKGFAVVAAEVKSLATQTNTATGQIEVQINGMHEIVENAVAAMRNVMMTITDVNEASATIAAAVQQQSAATTEISQSAAKAAQVTDEVGTNVDNVNNLADETGSAASSVRSASQQLSQQANMLSEEVNKFLSTIRAA